MSPSLESISDNARNIPPSSIRLSLKEAVTKAKINNELKRLNLRPSDIHTYVLPPIVVGTAQPVP